jgi:CRISPR/Cas system-associated protein Cas7 (RAMP superfamily)
MNRLQQQIVSRQMLYYQPKLRDALWELYKIESSEDLEKIGNSLKALGIAMKKSSKQWRLAYEKTK